MGKWTYMNINPYSENQVLSKLYTGRRYGRCSGIRPHSKPNIRKSNNSKSRISNPKVPQPTVPRPRICKPTVPRPRICKPTVPRPMISKPMISKPNVPQPNVPQPNERNKLFISDVIGGYKRVFCDRMSWECPICYNIFHSSVRDIKLGYGCPTCDKHINTREFKHHNSNYKGLERSEATKQHEIHVNEQEKLFEKARSFLMK